MTTLAVILARAGSKSLPDKCVLPLCGRPVISYTIEHARQSRRVDDIVVSTDSPRVRAIARKHGVLVIDRPAALADDTATVDAAGRHAVQEYERPDGRRAPVEVVVLLYGNVPVRASGIIDRVVEHLVRSGADSVRTVAPVGRHHPDWMHRLDGDRLSPYRRNSIYRRQDLEPLYYHDAAVAAVMRASLFSVRAMSDPQGFWGSDCRAVVQDPLDTVDVDGLADFYFAEAILRQRSESVFEALAPRVITSESRSTDRGWEVPSRPVLTGAVAYARHERR